MDEILLNLCEQPLYGIVIGCVVLAIIFFIYFIASVLSNIHNETKKKDSFLLNE